MSTDSLKILDKILDLFKKQHKRLVHGFTVHLVNNEMFWCIKSWDAFVY